jgi:hypothetical protein
MALKSIDTVILFGLVMLLVTAEIALLIAPSIAAAPGWLVIELSKVGSIVRVAYAGVKAPSRATTAQVAARRQTWRLDATCRNEVVDFITSKAPFSRRVLKFAWGCGATFVPPGAFTKSFTSFA